MATGGKAVLDHPFGHPEPMPDLTIDLVVAVLPVHDGRVGLVLHRQLNRWLPPGGHIGANELPDDAALREVREELGLEVTLVGDNSPVSQEWVNGVRPLIRPLAVRHEIIKSGHHHADLIYAAHAPNPDMRPDPTEVLDARWFALDQLDGIATPDLAMLAERAVSLVAGSSG